MGEIVAMLKAAQIQQHRDGCDDRTVDMFCSDRCKLALAAIFSAVRLDVEAVETDGTVLPETALPVGLTGAFEMVKCWCACCC